MAMEIRAENKYWHVYSGNNVYNNPAYTYSGGASGSLAANGIGIMWSNKVDDATFFNADLIARRIIQVIPTLPLTELYVPAGWVNAMVSSGEMATMLSQTGASDNSYQCFVQTMEAVVEAQATAWTGMTGLSAAQIDNGQSMTNLMYFVATRA